MALIGAILRLSLMERLTRRGAEMERIKITIRNEATDALMRQIGLLQDMAGVVKAAIEDITGTIDPDVATWGDVARHALLVDQVRAILNPDA
jgi:hypothetical protein